jgi:hypothetical protein
VNFTTLHAYAHPILFKPSIAEVINQIPIEIIKPYEKIYITSEVVNKKITECIYNNAAHIAKTTLLIPCPRNKSVLIEQEYQLKDHDEKRYKSVNKLEYLTSSSNRLKRSREHFEGLNFKDNQKKIYDGLVFILRSGKHICEDEIIALFKIFYPDLIKEKETERSIKKLLITSGRFNLVSYEPRLWGLRVLFD